MAIKQMLKRNLTTVIAFAIIITGGYFAYQKLTADKEAVRYAIAAVEKGTLIVSVSGSGQVSASNQVDIKPKVSGDVVYVGVKNGQEVKAGTLLVQIDSSDAQKALRDARTSLETANLELDKLLEPIDELDLLKAENNLAKAKEAEQKTEDNITKGYEDAFNTAANAFLDLPTLIAGLRDVLYGYGLEKDSWNISVFANSILSATDEDQHKLEKFIDNAELAYQTARTKYDDNFENYKNASRYSDEEVIEALLNETLETIRAMSEAVKNETNMLDYWVDYRSSRNLPVFSKVTEYQSDLKTYTSKTNSHLSSLLNTQRTLQDNKEAVLNAQRSIEELELSLSKLKSGVDELDVRAKKISIQQKQDALATAQQKLADYYIRAPFDGIVANVSAKKGELISSAAVATLLTKQKMADITLNEIDVAKVKAEQKATITFDAVEELTLSGKVIEVDALGTASQGVVTYNVKIAFDAQDERIKPGMSLSAAVITEAKQDVLLVPISAVKQQDDISYVQIADGTATDLSSATANISGALIPASNLRTQQVQAGLSNDTMIEVTDGLKEGDLVVTQTITSTSQNQSQQSTGFGAFGGSSGNREVRTIMPR